MKYSHGLLKKIIPKEIIKKISKECYSYLKKFERLENYYGNIHELIPETYEIINTDIYEFIKESISEIKNQGGLASGELIDATKENVIEELIEKIEKDIGAIEVLIYNLGAQSGFKNLAETSLKEFEWGWKMASQGLFRALKYFVL